MEYISENKISEELVNSFDEEMTLSSLKGLKKITIILHLMA